MSVCNSPAQNRFHLLIFLSFSDLDLFSSEERESVYVKEGQGAVLLCAPPPHYPGLFDLLPFSIIFCLFLVSSTVRWKETSRSYFHQLKSHYTRFLRSHLNSSLLFYTLLCLLVSANPTSTILKLYSFSNFAFRLKELFSFQRSVDV